MSKITIWLKIGKVFIDQESIRGLKRLGLQTKISLFDNQDIIVNATYDKVVEMLPAGKF